MAVRNTKARKLVSSAFETSDLPLMIEDVHVLVQKKLPKTAFSTVYRIIQKLLSESKLIAVDWRERSSRYEWAGKHHHHHLVCNSCGTVSDIDDETLNFKAETVAAKTGFLIKDHSIELFGECAPCQRGA